MWPVSSTGEIRGRVLVVVESFTCPSAIAASLAIVFGLPAFPVFLVFAIVTSVSPLLLDVADEMYAGLIAQRDQTGALKFNIAVYSAIGLVSSFIARLLGSALVSVGVLTVLVISAAVSLCAVGLRMFGARALWSASAPAAKAASDEPVEPVPTDTKRSVRAVLAARTPGSPVFSGLSAAASATLATYLGLWSVSGIAHANVWLVVPLIAVGAGATLVPFAARAVTKIGGGAFSGSCTGCVWFSRWRSSCLRSRLLPAVLGSL